MTSIRNLFARSLGVAVTSSALLAAPSFAGGTSAAQQLQPAGEAPLAAGQSAPKETEIAQTYIPLVGEVGSASGQGTGFYLTVGAGAAWPSSQGFQDNLDNFNFHGTNNYTGGFAVDGGLGYDFGAIRTELTYGFARASLRDVNVHGYQDFDASGNLNKNDVMGSVYFDIPFGNWVPYIGGGIGYTNLGTPGFTVDGERFGGGNKGLFGWQAKAGVAYVLSWNTDLYLEGTYSGASGFDSGNLSYDSFNNWGTKLGVRYRFGAPPVKVVAQPAPAPEPAPAPAPEPAPAPAPIRGLW